jgi:two-component system sensor histidine kinase KdpD
MAERQRVAQSVVHDMSDPLTAIEFALAELRELSSPDSDPIPHAVTSRLANEIGSGAYSLRRLVLNLRDIGVGEDGALAPRWQLTALVPVARNVVELARPAARRRTLTLELASDGEDISVRCDPDLVRRILENLVFNAVDYAPPSSTIRMHLRDLGHSVEIRVEDEGEGISPAERERIFDLYGRGHQPGHRISRGIGLAFCRTAARAQGGDVDVERREPQGSVFVFRLPHR